MLCGASGVVPGLVSIVNAYNKSVFPVLIVASNSIYSDHVEGPYPDEHDFNNPRSCQFAKLGNMWVSSRHYIGVPPVETWMTRSPTEVSNACSKFFVHMSS